MSASRTRLLVQTAAQRWDGLVDSLFASRRNQLFLLAVVSLTLRISTFGHPNLDSDEAFYLLVGQEMHAGELPYVDIWDRKPLGLFIIYYLIAGLSNSVLAYQLVACASVVLTASFICDLACKFTRLQGGLLAGILYPVALPVFFGFGGQAPIFYNLMIAASAWLVLMALPDLRRGVISPNLYVSALLSGLAVSIKQTAMFEAAFLGGYALVTVGR